MKTYAAFTEEQERILIEWCDSELTLDNIRTGAAHVTHVQYGYDTNGYDKFPQMSYRHGSGPLWHHQDILMIELHEVQFYLRIFRNTWNAYYGKEEII